MDKAQALHAFWSSFSWLAIDEQSAYDTGTMEALGDPDRFITYEVQVGELDEMSIALTASLWHRSTSWADITAKANEIYNRVGRGGIKVDYDGGQIWITRGNPFYRRGPTEESYDMRRITININAEYLSA